jgi:GAF domain-containing protein
LAVVRDVTAQREAEQALAHARDAAARRAAEFAAAAQASRAVVGGGTPRTQLERLVRHILEVTGFDAAVVFSCHARDRQLCVEAVHHQRTDALPGLAALLGTRWTGEELLGFTPPSHGGLVQVIPSVSGAPLDVVGRDHWARAAGFVTLVRVPLTYNGILEGGITLASCRPRQVTADDEQLYRTLADQLSIVVHNLIEYERVREMRRDAIFRLAVACEVRDPETVAHLQRIYALTQELGRELGIAGGALEDLALSSVLHDAGKIRTPDTILWKPGLLGEEELAIVRLHTMHGEQLLAGPEFYATARQIARHHPERWDGSGYPDGLAGEAIPLPARIVAVADVFDALTARRVYRPAWPEERAAREIIAQAGRLFDPRVVAAFEALYRADRLPPRALGSA